MRYDHLDMLPDNAFRKIGKRLATLEGGGGKGGGSKSAPAPTSQTVTNTSIPEYARPYVERMLGKSEALTDINQNPYQTYGGERIAEFSPLQKQAFQSVANQTTAGQLGGATQLAGTAGLGALGTAGRMGNVGMDYMRMATSPAATQAFMNPYLQASLAPQLAEIQRQSTITAQGLKGQATAQGAFGGNRAALQQAENQRNALMAQQQAIGQGYNTAFQNAQQAQQFGANLGLQGLQGQLSGYGQAGALAGTLGQLGQTQFGQEQAINQAQQQVGAVQQAQQQQQLDQAYQDFLKQQNYPYQQLAFMSDMLRGLPLSQSAQQQYTAPPSAVSQLGGLGMAGLGIYGAAGGFKAEGGAIKEKKYASGGAVDGLSDAQLKAIINDKTSNPIKVAAAEEQLLLRSRMRNNPQARIGVAAISTGDMVPETMAGGGIVAFAGDRGSYVDSRRFSAPGLSEADIAYGDALRDSAVANAAGTLLDYTALLPYTIGKKGYNYLKGRQPVWDPVQNKYVLQRELPDISSADREAKKLAGRKVQEDYLAAQEPAPTSSVEAPTQVTQAGLGGPYSIMDPKAIAEKEAALLKERFGLNKPDAGADKGLAAVAPRKMDYSSLNYKQTPDRSADFAAMSEAEKTPEQLMAEHQARVGDNEALAAIKERLKGMEAKAALAEERAPWMALAKAGFATMGAGTDPKTGRQLTFLESLGKGAQEGMEDYTKAQKELAAGEKERFALANQLAQAERAEKLASVKYGEDSAEAIKARNKATKLAALNYNVNRDIATSKGEQDAAIAKIHAQQTDAQLAQSAAQHAQTYDLQLRKLNAELKDKPLDTQIATLSASAKGYEAIIRDQNAEPEDKAVAVAKLNAINDKLNELGGVKMPTQAAALPMPKTQAELKTGSIYNTARGPAKWDGKQFVSQ